MKLRPNPAQDKAIRGPFAALLLLLGLFLAPANAAPGAELRLAAGSVSDLQRASAVLRTSGQVDADDDRSDAEPQSFAPPSPPVIFTRIVGARPTAEPGIEAREIQAAHTHSPYRARAPPAA